RVVHDLLGVLDADAGDRRAVASGAGRLAVGRAGALGQEIEPVVAWSGGRVDLLTRDAGGVAVRVAGQRRVVHEADRAASDEVDLLADGEVRRVEGRRLVGEPLGRRAEGVRDELLGASTRDAARSVVVDAVTLLVTED